MSEEKTTPPQPPRAAKPLKVFSAASFLNDLGAEMLFPIWPLFVRNFLGLPLSFLGLVDGVGDALNALSQVASGLISDRVHKKKPFIVLGYFLAFLGRFGLSFSSTGPAILGFRSLDRLGKLRDAPRDAYLADITKQKGRGLSFGILRMFDNLGAVFGIVLSIFLFPILGFRKLIFLAALPTLFSVLAIGLLIKDRRGLGGASPVRGRGMLRALAASNGASRSLKILLLAIGIFALGNFSYSFLLIGAEELGFSQTTVPILYLVYTIATFLIAAPAGQLADLIGRKRALGLSLFFWMLTLAGFIFAPSQWFVWPLFASYGLFKGSFETVSRVFAADLAPAGLRASTLGFLQLIIGLLALPASFIAGTLWELTDFRLPFALSFGLTLISLSILAFVKERAPTS